MHRKCSTNSGSAGIVFLLIVVLIGFAGGFLYKTYNENLNPVDENDTSQVLFTIENNSTLNGVLTQLQEAGLINDEYVAKIYVKLNKVGSIYAGTYYLSKSMPLEEILEIISSDHNAIVDEVTVTIVDGYWAKDAARVIAENTNLEYQDILDKWNDVDYLKELIAKYDFLTDEILDNDEAHVYLEGYIYPDTYRFYRTTTIEAVTEKILDQMAEIYQKYKDQIEASDYTFHQIITLASVVQFEASTMEDMYKVSGVFYNRLACGMYLQSSVTVLYALYDYDSWTDGELYVNQQNPSKYNTYMHPGLPIGPICNPQENAIKATLNPDDNDYLYFCADLNGNVYYAKTYQEHLNNVSKYLN